MTDQLLARLHAGWQPAEVKMLRDVEGGAKQGHVYPVRSFGTCVEVLVEGREVEVYHDEYAVLAWRLRGDHPIWRGECADERAD